METMMKPPPQQPKAVVLLSGGQDSTTALAWAVKKYGRGNVHALSIDYGQRHAKEITAAVAIAKMLRAPHRVASVRVDLSGTLASGEPSTLAARIGASPAMVPGRNLILLSMAAGYASSIGADVLIIGACEADAAAFPDCRPAFLIAAEGALGAALSEPMRIVAPLLALSKAATVAMARGIPGCWEALALSWTCYAGGDVPCGECTACVARIKGFADAGEIDPAVAA
jgi:7-cyano-7-deazaguanine synthase